MRNAPRSVPLRAAEHMRTLRTVLSLRRLYVDLDGTLLGPGGSLFSSPGGITGEPAAAVAEMASAGVELVLVSGRTREQMRDTARVLGAAAYIAEMGGLLVYREGGTETVVANQGRARSRVSPHAEIERSGAAGFLLDRFAPTLEPHAPWAFVPRECSVLLRGKVELAEARSALRDAGYGWLDFLDNGILPAGPERFPRLSVDEVHVYHLVPAGVSKRSAVALDRARAGLGQAECVAVGDSPSDAEMAPEVGAVFIVANGAASLEGLGVLDNVYVTEGSHGLGLAEVVLPLISAG